jgi:hypothetical protein
MTCVTHLDVRRTDGHVTEFVTRIVDELEAGTRLVDISPHDTRGTVICMRVPEHRP